MQQQYTGTATWMCARIVCWMKFAHSRPIYRFYCLYNVSRKYYCILGNIWIVLTNCCVSNLWSIISLYFVVTCTRIYSSHFYQSTQNTLSRWYRIVWNLASDSVLLLLSTSFMMVLLFMWLLCLKEWKSTGNWNENTFDKIVNHSDSVSSHGVVKPFEINVRPVGNL
jgi:hypothetical protein